MKKILLVTPLVLGLFAHALHAQPSGRGGGMNRGPDWQTRMIWTSFCFDMSPTDAQVTKAFPLFRETIAKQKAVMEKYPEPTPEAMAEIQKIQADMDAKFKALLTPEQLKKMAEVEAQRQQRQQQMRERMQGAGGPPGGGGPR
jgi:hypothetical protein